MTTRKQLALRYGAVVALFVVVVLALARLKPAEIGAEPVTAAAPSTASVAEDEESDTLSPPPPDVVERATAPIKEPASSARASPVRATRAAAQRRDSFTVEVVIEARGKALEALDRATITLEPDKSISPLTKKQERELGVRTRTITTVAKNAREFEHLCLGTWTVSIHASGFDGDSQRITCNWDGVRVRVDLALRAPHTFHVTIHDVDGVPLERSAWLPAEVREQLADRIAPHVCADAPGALPAPRTSCPSTTYRTTHIGGNRNAEYEVEAHVSGTVWVCAIFGDSLLAAAAVDEGTTRVALAIPADAVLAAFRTVELRVREADGGAPIEGAHAGLPTVSGRELGLVTGPDGRARAICVASGVLWVRVSKDGYGSVIARLDTSSLAITALDVDLAPEVTLSGLLVGVDGFGCAGTVVAVPEDREAPSRFHTVGDEVDVGSDGAFTFRGLVRGSYLLADARLGRVLSERVVRGASERGGPLPEHVVRVDAGFGSVSGIIVTTLPAKR